MELWVEELVKISDDCYRCGCFGTKEDLSIHQQRDAKEEEITSLKRKVTSTYHSLFFLLKCSTFFQIQESQEIINRAKSIELNFQVKCGRCGSKHLYSEMTLEQQSYHVHLTVSFINMAKHRIAFLLKEIDRLKSMQGDIFYKYHSIEHVQSPLVRKFKLPRRNRRSDKR